MNAFMLKLRKSLWFGLAAVFLFEAWLWDFLGAALVRLLAFGAIQRFRAGFENFVRGLSPLASLALFAIPLILLAPIKLAALYCFARRQFIAGLFCILAAKLVGFAAGAYLFDLCRPQLLQMPVFAKLYATLTRWRRLAEAMLAPFRAALRAKLAPVRAALSKLRQRSEKSFIARLRALSRRWIVQKG